MYKKSKPKNSCNGLFEFQRSPSFNSQPSRQTLLELLVPAMDGKQFTEVIEIWSSPNDGSSPESFPCYAKFRPTARMNPRKKKTVKRDLDCVILECNPFEPANDHAKKLAFEDEDVELTIIAERGRGFSTFEASLRRISVHPNAT